MPPVKQNNYGLQGWPSPGAAEEYIASAAGAISANGNSANFNNNGGRGVKVVVDITALAGTSPTLTVIIEYKDPASGKFITLLSSAALAAVATTELTVYPGAVVTANVSANNSLPKTWRVRWVIGGTAGPIVTASIGAIVLP